MKILMLVLMFFILGALFIIENNNFVMYKHENLENFSKLYIQWMNQIYVNAQKLTGEAVQSNWFPE